MTGSTTTVSLEVVSRNSSQLSRLGGVSTLCLDGSHIHDSKSIDAGPTNTIAYHNALIGHQRNVVIERVNTQRVCTIN